MLRTFQHSPRPLVIVGEEDCVVPNWVQRIELTDYDKIRDELIELCAANVGDSIMRAYMRGEWHA